MMFAIVRSPWGQRPRVQPRNDRLDPTETPPRLVQESVVDELSERLTVHPLHHVADEYPIPASHDSNREQNCRRHTVVHRHQKRGHPHLNIASPTATPWSCNRSATSSPVETTMSTVRQRGMQPSSSSLVRAGSTHPMEHAQRPVAASRRRARPAGCLLNGRDDLSLGMTLSHHRFDHPAKMSMLTLAIGEHAGHGSNEMTLTERLADVGDGAGPGCTREPVAIPAATERDDRDASLLEDARGRLHTVETRQAQIHEDHVGLIRPCKCDCLLAVTGRPDEKTRVLEHEANVRANDRVVLNR
jgi:hypothetical protein